MQVSENEKSDGKYMTDLLPTELTQDISKSLTLHWRSIWNLLFFLSDIIILLHKQYSIYDNYFLIKRYTFICCPNFDAARTSKFKKERIAYKMTWYTLIVKISQWTWNNLIKFYTAPATSPKLLRVLLRYRKRG